MIIQFIIGNPDQLSLRRRAAGRRADQLKTRNKTTTTTYKLSHRFGSFYIYYFFYTIHTLPTASIKQFASRTVQTASTRRYIFFIKFSSNMFIVVRWLIEATQNRIACKIISYLQKCVCNLLPHSDRIFAWKLHIFNVNLVRAIYKSASRNRFFRIFD